MSFTHDLYYKKYLKYKTKYLELTSELRGGANPIPPPPTELTHATVNAHITQLKLKYEDKPPHVWLAVIRPWVYILKQIMRNNLLSRYIEHMEKLYNNLEKYITSISTQIPNMPAVSMIDLLYREIIRFANSSQENNDKLINVSQLEIERVELINSIDEYNQTGYYNKQRSTHQFIAKLNEFITRYKQQIDIWKDTQKQITEDIQKNDPGPYQSR